VNFLLRDATRDDLPRLQDVFRRSSLSNEGDRAALIAHPEALVFSETSLSAGRVRVATVEPDLIVGFATTVIEPGFLELVDLFTDPEWMRRGVATTLIRDIVEFATSIGVARVSVIANPHASDFYQGVGFVAEGHTPTAFGQGLRMHLVTEDNR
jgi:GNAT superfamily N-acetyltransferase